MLRLNTLGQSPVRVSYVTKLRISGHCTQTDLSKSVTLLRIKHLPCAINYANVTFISLFFWGP